MLAARIFSMTTRTKFFFAMLVAVIFCLAQLSQAQVDPRWKTHDMSRPLPAVIDPGTASTQETAGRAPSDAIVLLDGKDLSQWVDKDGQPPKWKLEHGYVEVTPHSGDLVTRRPFGDMQLHSEFAEPLPAVGKSQERGNSGVILMGQYEVQVLDSFHNDTYADGQAAAVYGQYPPQVNASRAPGEWQAYDIVFHGPRFDKDGKLLRKAHVTVLHNGVLVQDNVEIEGITRLDPTVYKVVPEKLPLHLQDHGTLVRYRNIWVRELGVGQ
jgi:hypothetical protein